MKFLGLLSSAQRFIMTHKKFTAFYAFLLIFADFITFLMINSFKVTVGDTVVEASASTANIFWTSIIPDSLLEVFRGSYSTPLFLLLLSLNAFLFMVAVFVVQAYLQHHKASIRHEVAHVFKALVKAPWAILLLAYNVLLTAGIVGLFGLSPLTIFFLITVVNIVVYIAFLYHQQLLYNNYYNISSVVKTSWSYLAKSWVPLILVLLFIGFLTGPFLFLLAYVSSAPAVTFPAVAFIAGCIRFYATMLSMIMINIIYHTIHARQ